MMVLMLMDVVSLYSTATPDSPTVHSTYRHYALDEGSVPSSSVR